jgi:hypothetical protein
MHVLFLSLAVSSAAVAGLFAGCLCAIAQRADHRLSETGVAHM